MPKSPPFAESLSAPAYGLLAGLARLHQTVMVVDGDERVVWVSEALADLSGGRARAGVHARELFGAPERHDEIRRGAEARGHLANEPIELLREGADPLPVELSIVAVPRTCARGMLLAIVRPLGERATRPEDLGLDYYRAILGSSSDAVIALDARGYVTYVNPALEALLGDPAHSLVGAPVALAFARSGSIDGLAEALRPARDGCGAELELVRKDGSTRYFSVTSNPVVLPDGTAAGRVAFLRDVTRQRMSERALARKNDELEHYVHAVSHDLRTPLVSLLGFSRLLAQDYGEVLTDTGRHFLERIEQASRTMESLINDLLELSRIGSGGAQADWIDPLPILKQLGNELKPRLEAAGIELRLPDSPPVVRCVRTQLYQIFSNLLGNAVQHMGECESPRIAVEVEEVADGVHLRVCDNGCGLPGDQHERVFEIFQTGPRRAHGSRGTGIGLAIVKKIAEAHGGRAWVESEPGAGARFCVELPRS